MLTRLIARPVFTAKSMPCGPWVPTWAKAELRRSVSTLLRSAFYKSKNERHFTSLPQAIFRLYPGLLYTDHRLKIWKNVYHSRLYQLNCTFTLHLWRSSRTTQQKNTRRSLERMAKAVRRKEQTFNSTGTSSQPPSIPSPRPVPGCQHICPHDAPLYLATFPSCLCHKPSTRRHLRTYGIGCEWMRLDEVDSEEFRQLQMVLTDGLR
ncbi:hypothetical protein JOM56_015485 [Amanita muscaria]